MTSLSDFQTITRLKGYHNFVNEETYIVVMNSIAVIKIRRGAVCVILFVLASLVPVQAQLKRDSLNLDSIVLSRKPVKMEIPKRLLSQINIYDMPYSMTASYPNWKRLWINTGALYTAGFVALGVLEMLPDSATNWNTEELRRTPWIQRWGNHVSKGMHWDGDNPIFNYILHPYGGAAYFMSARSQGFNFWQSTLYCFCISTFFWEYGIEAFMEIPSVQDMIITPVAGALIGECFYKVKRRIVADGYTLWGSSILGNVVAFLVDPVNEFVGFFAGNPCRQNLKEKRKRTEIALYPTLNATRNTGTTYGLTLNIVF